MEATDRLVVGLSSWIIQDGNYSDFARGDDVAFALEFYPPAELELVNCQARRILSHSGGPWYDIVGKVAHVADKWWAIDIGFVVFRDEAPPKGVKVGCWLKGKIYVGIDPFFYFESLAHQPDAPALIYDWRVERIEMQTSPYVPHPQDDPRKMVFARDPERQGWIEIDKTDAWQDDQGSADYILHCRRLPGPARHALSVSSGGSIGY